MGPEKFKEANKIVDSIANEVSGLHDTGHLDEVQKSLEHFCRNLDEKLSINVTINVNIFDEDREKSVELTEFGYSCNGGERAYPVSSREAFNRYKINNEIVEIPASYCPVCWSIWDFKEFGQSCRECNNTFGKEVKLLLDNNSCPDCGEGEITEWEPKCKNCGFYVDPKCVVWK